MNINTLLSKARDGQAFEELDAMSEPDLSEGLPLQMIVSESSSLESEEPEPKKTTSSSSPEEILVQRQKIKKSHAHLSSEKQP